jgi:2-keto-4-pentenoate hydratase
MSSRQVRQIEKLALDLQMAEKNVEPVRPFGELHGLSVEDAYRVQKINIARRLAAGEKIVGHKIGLTSDAMQRALGVDEPDFGSIMSSMVVGSRSNIRIADLIAPKVEAEIALWFRGRLPGSKIGPDDLLGPLSGVSLAIEIIDSRVADWNITLAETIADNASSARVVVGRRQIVPDGMELRDLCLAIRRNDDIVDQGMGSAVMGDPMNAAMWLADKLQEFGTEIYSDQFVMTGAVHAAFSIQAGDHISVSAGSGLDDVDVLFD